MIMETNKKLIAVVEIGGDKAVQFWARADDLAQQYNEKSTDIVYTVVKLPDSDNLFRFFAAAKEEMKYTGHRWDEGLGAQKESK